MSEATGTLESVPGFEALGFRAFTTTRHAGDFGLASAEPAISVFGRWEQLLGDIRPVADRLATAHQVHGRRLVVHDAAWEGWLRCPDADGHVSFAPRTAMAVTLADCVPVFLAHPSGAGALVHSGWKGTAARIVDVAIDVLVQRGLAAGELVVHAGPAICGRCYEVGPDVFEALTGRRASRPMPVDLRAIILDQARARGVVALSSSESCTRCHNDRFYSHRAGDAGRQLGVLITPGGRASPSR